MLRKKSYQTQKLFVNTSIIDEPNEAELLGLPLIKS